ncbi:MAG: hypothetical protein RBQ81_00510 [Arcobacteraceae bacterium]|jgi:hypothetical protein|nr:hypothetical protein [Arcobacteraceae bacterium]
MMKKLLITVIIALGLHAAPIEMGTKIDNLEIVDQFEKLHKIGEDTKLILFASDKETSDILKDYLLSQKENILEKNSAVYVADISGMPSIISKFIALPKMKKYPFSILLLDENSKELFTKEDGKIIVYDLENLEVKNIRKISISKELEEIIK